MSFEACIERAWWSAVDEVKGERAVSVAAQSAEFEQALHVLAVGKAAPSMLKGLLQAGVAVERALVITKDGHSDAELQANPAVEQIESSHPVPDQRSLDAGERVLAFVQACAVDQPVLLLVSGGASALVEKLIPGESLASLQQKTQALLAAGADIGEINTVRCSLSVIKGGGLEKLCGSDIESWLLSDVAGDDPAVIGSGIGLLSDSSRHTLVASNAVARTAAVAVLEQEGMTVRCNEESLYDDVFVIADQVAAQLKAGEPGVYVLGGEPTVLLPDNPGEGGRNQALALALAVRLAGQPVVGLVAGTDGSDGPTDAAGGWFGRASVDAAGATAALTVADAGSFLRDTGQLFVTGPTGTNVMDLLIAVKY